MSDRARGRADVEVAPAEPLTDQITAYLANGGFFNPELMNHDVVRDDLLMRCRDELAALATQQAEHQQIRALCRDAGMTDESTTLDYLRGVFYMLKKKVAQQAAIRALAAEWCERAVASDHMDYERAAEELAKLLDAEPGETKA